MEDEHDDEDIGHPYGKIRKGPLVFSRNEDDERAVRRLIDIEPDLTRMIAGKRAWSLVSETAKKIAIWLTAVSGGFFVLREILRSMAL